MITKKYIYEELKKALHRCIAKADPVLQQVLSDLDDKNSKAQVNPDDIPKIYPEHVLNKEDPSAMPKEVVSANPRPVKEPKNPAMPKNPMAPKMPKAPGMPKPPGMGKTDLPLKSFMKRFEEPMSKSEEKPQYVHLSQEHHIERNGRPNKWTKQMPKHMNDLSDIESYHGQKMHRVSDSPKGHLGEYSFKVNPDKSLTHIGSKHDTSD